MTSPDSPEVTPAAPPTFDAIPLSADLRRAIDACGYTHPTPVQLAVFEPASRGRNVVVQARTGTGKTAAFGLPILDALVKKSIAKVQALILTPTRELALQVASELERLGQFKGTKITSIYGGAPMGKQIDELAGGAQVVVGTPGRVLDHLRRGTFDPSEVRIFVLDEADEMLSMGFAKELHAIVERLPKERQGLFFSATIPPDIERLAHAQLRDPEFITLSSDQVGALSIQHYVYFTRGDKRADIIRVIEVEDPESAVLFCNTKDETERLCEALQNKGYDADWLNGDLEQKERERVMSKTREGKLRFLVATDVAARGIDISHLTHVINADFPESAEYYVHRTGRTGRAGRTGTAISMVGPKDIGSLYLLRLTYKIRPIEKQLPSAGELKTRAEADLVAMFVEAFSQKHPDADDLALARRLLTHADAERIVAGLLRDHLGAKPQAKTEAAEARRAKNPAPLHEPVSEPQPATRQEGAIGRGPERPPYRQDKPRAMGARPAPTDRGGRDRGRTGDRGRAPHKSFTNWEPPADPDDDKPILATDPPPGMRERPLPPPLPGVTVSDDAMAPTARERPAPPSQAQPQSQSQSQGQSVEEPGFTQIFVNVGRRDGAKPGDIQKVLVEGAGFTPEDAGRIRMRDRNTFVSVREESLEKAIAAFTGQTIGGRSVRAEPAKPRTA